MKETLQNLGLICLLGFVTVNPSFGQPTSPPPPNSRVNGNGTPAPQTGNSSTSNAGQNGPQTGTVNQTPSGPPVMNGAPPTPAPATPPAPQQPALGQ